jgi:hypothetical protein
MIPSRKGNADAPPASAHWGHNRACAGGPGDGCQKKGNPVGGAPLPFSRSAGGIALPQFNRNGHDWIGAPFASSNHDVWFPICQINHATPRIARARPRPQDHARAISIDGAIHGPEPPARSLAIDQFHIAPAGRRRRQFVSIACTKPGYRVVDDSQGVRRSPGSRPKNDSISADKTDRNKSPFLRVPPPASLPASRLGLFCLHIPFPSNRRPPRGTYALSRPGRLLGQRKGTTAMVHPPTWKRPG